MTLKVFNPIWLYLEAYDSWKRRNQVRTEEFYGSSRTASCEFFHRPWISNRPQTTLHTERQVQSQANNKQQERVAKFYGWHFFLLPPWSRLSLLFVYNKRLLMTSLRTVCGIYSLLRSLIFSYCFFLYLNRKDRHAIGLVWDRRIVSFHKKISRMRQIPLLLWPPSLVTCDYSLFDSIA